MPIYEFECDDCGKRFDRLQKLSDPDPDTCPHCGKHVHRCVTAPAFRLAGTGWYETDFKKPGDKKHNLADHGEHGAGKSGGSATDAATPAKAATSSSKGSTTTSASVD